MDFHEVGKLQTSRESILQSKVTKCLELALISVLCTVYLQSTQSGGRMSIVNFLQRNTGWTAALVSFLIGMVLGAPGGLLLGSVEESIFSDFKKNSVNFGEQIDLWIEMPAYCMSMTMVSSAAGIWTASKVYSYFIKAKGEEAKGKALALAGPVCLMVMSVVGALLGIALLRDTVFCGVFRVMVIIITNFLCWFSFFHFFKSDLPSIGFLALAGSWVVYTHVWCGLLFVHVPLYIPRVGALFCGLLIVMLVFCIHIFYDTTRRSFICTAAFFLWSAFGMVEMTVISTSKMNFGLELILLIILPSQVLMKFIGMSVFDTWQKGGAVKTCVASVSCGGAVYGILNKALSVLGLGPSVGLLLAVMGAVGVSLAAAWAEEAVIIDKYGGAQKLGVFLGAEVGAFVASSSLGVFSGLAIAYHSTSFFIMHAYLSSFDYSGSQMLAGNKYMECHNQLR